MISWIIKTQVQTAVEPVDQKYGFWGFLFILPLGNLEGALWPIMVIQTRLKRSFSSDLGVFGSFDQHETTH